MSKPLKVGYLIVGRLKSTRLPRKLLLEIQGKPIIDHMIDRLKLAKAVHEIVLCTSTLEQDTPLVEVAERNGISCYRGDPDDVLVRLLGAAEQHELDYILHITADCPFADPHYADKIYKAYLDTNADLIRQFELPHGAFSYGIKVEALRRVVEIKGSSDTEVWGRYFTDTGLFSVVDLSVDNPHHKRPGLRMTLDYPEDFKFIASIFAALYKEEKVFSLDQILNFLDLHPEIVDINKKCAVNYNKRFLAQSEPSLKRVAKVRNALIIGAGSIGQRHIRNLKQIGIENIVALRTRKGHFKSLPESLGVEEVFDIADLRDRQLDIAIISNPSSLHLDTVRQVADLVRGVFVEKPLSNSLEGGPEVADLLWKNRVVSFVGHNMMFHPAVRSIIGFYNRNDVGNIINIQCQVGQWLPDWHPYEEYREAYYARKDLGGGVTLTLSHEIHMALELAGTPAEVYGMVRTSELLDVEVDSCTDLMIRHRSGVVSQIHLDYLQRPLHRSGVVTFERGWISYDLNRMEVFGQTDADDSPRLVWADNSYDTNEMYIDEIREFIRFTEEGRLRHKHDIASSLDTLRVIDASFASAVSGHSVTVR